jgi:hypothetical protein
MPPPGVQFPSERASADLSESRTAPWWPPGRLRDELMPRIRQFAVLIGAALAQPSLYLFGNVANPTLREIKANDANRVAVAFPQIVDDSFKIGVFNVCLSPSTTHSAEIVEDQIDIPVDAADQW